MHFFLFLSKFLKETVIKCERNKNLKKCVTVTHFLGRVIPSLLIDLSSTSVQFKDPCHNCMSEGAPFEILRMFFFFCFFFFFGGGGCSFFYPNNLSLSCEGTLVVVNAFFIRKPFRQYTFCVG